MVTLRLGGSREQTLSVVPLKVRFFSKTVTLTPFLAKFQERSSKSQIRKVGVLGMPSLPHMGFMG